MRKVVERQGNASAVVNTSTRSNFSLPSIDLWAGDGQISKRERRRSLRSVGRNSWRGHHSTETGWRPSSHNNSAKRPWDSDHRSATPRTIRNELRLTRFRRLLAGVDTVAGTVTKNQSTSSQLGRTAACPRTNSNPQTLVVKSTGGAFPGGTFPIKRCGSASLSLTTSLNNSLHRQF